MVHGYVFMVIIHYYLKLNEMEQKLCLECGEQIQGRSDKKFCSDYCRNSHNNKVNTESKNLIRNTNNRLKKKL